MADKFQGSALRSGRYSQEGGIYHVTTVTKSRQPYFADTKCARLMCQTLHWADKQGYTTTYCFVVMPDHFHWLFSLGNRHSLPSTMNLVKGRSGRLSGGRIWQRGYHDHALRSEESVKDIARYIVANPLRAGLVSSIREYPYWNATWL
ncbi:hypothetical protein Y5S_02690 [Alcanivorax nanhaiticus]|uniref:Transposase IS200-like domain-containing protein n=1 Tax=Alcanivorax nanhaiticus TaxID=1177154 RepID=A0A095UNT3_9GAMM|nr:transposase [Alcanivorax nanhaiticus]KGD64150.1 hypothetical protein Y5S_02690 [Alcanivorax nanhaiticus]